MRPIDADIGREKLWEIYNAWNLAMAPAEGREIAYVDKKMRLCELMIKFLDQLPTITPPPNDPLTLDELREMDGEPVWIVSHPLAEWNIIHSCHPNDVVGGGVIMTRRTAEKRTYPYADYGKTWLAYRRKPEEGTT